MDAIKFSSIIRLKNLPIQWLSRVELFYPDLPQTPIVYIHFVLGGTRIYGFPVSFNSDINKDNTCNIDVTFLSNCDIDKNQGLKDAVKNELCERFGLSHKIGIEHVKDTCNNDTGYEAFFEDLWQYVAKLYGKYIPFGKYFEEIDSMVRFVSAWQPKTGRQSEMRMRYNFFSIFGEEIEVEGNWDYLEFFLIPTYQDIRNNTTTEFIKFHSLLNSMTILWNRYFTKDAVVGDKTFKVMEGAWPIAKDKFMRSVTQPMLDENVITIEQKMDLDRLVDAFNRHSWRAAYFIWSIMTLKTHDYYTWDKEFFIDFYSTKKGVGVSEKVVACFLQQGFGNTEAIPLDIWVDSFREYVLGSESKESFFNDFSNIGKLERVIWLSSQAKKTNIKLFFDMLWCIRYGDTGNNELRQQNPIACYECKLRNTCVGYSQIKDKKVLLQDVAGINIETLKKGHFISSEDIIIQANEAEVYFICLTNNKVPKKVFVYIKDKWKLIDEFSGFILSNQKVPAINTIVTVEKMIDSLPAYF